MGTPTASHNYADSRVISTASLRECLEGKKTKTKKTYFHCGKMRCSSRSKLYLRNHHNYFSFIHKVTTPLPDQLNILLQWYEKKKDNGFFSSSKKNPSQKYSVSALFWRRRHPRRDKVPSKRGGILRVGRRRKTNLIKGTVALWQSCTVSVRFNDCRCCRWCRVVCR